MASKRQFVAGGESLITAAVNTMASSFIAITFKAKSSGAVGTVSAGQLLNENTRNNNNHTKLKLFRALNLANFLGARPLSICCLY